MQDSLIFSILISIAILSSTAGKLIITKPTKDFMSWTEFKVHFHKSYSNSSEENIRMEIFNEHLREIILHNIRFAKGKVNWKMGITEFTDRNPDEFLRKMKSRRKSFRKANSYESFQSDPNFTLAKAFDWRREGAVTPARHQYDCGSCFIFASVAAFETQFSRKTGHLINLSEQSLLDCADKLSCNGGDPNDVMEFVLYNGVAEEKDYFAYGFEKEECRFEPDKEAFKISAYFKLNTEEEILEAIQRIGPVVVVLDGHYLRLYNEGILWDNKLCRELNHAVTIVGFGTDEKGEDFYIAKNSWGESFGENGFVRFRRGINYCLLTSLALVPVY